MNRIVYWGLFVMPSNPTTSTDAQFLVNAATATQGPVAWPRGTVVHAQLDGGAVQDFPTSPHSPVAINYSGLALGSHDCKIWADGSPEINPESGDFVWQIVSA